MARFRKNKGEKLFCEMGNGVRRRALSSWGPDGQMRQVTVKQVGDWGEGWWTRDTP